LKNILEFLDSDESLTTFKKTLTKTQLAKTLVNDGPFTVFAPTNAAFEKLSSEFIDSLLVNQEKQLSILKNHIINKKLTTEDLKKTVSVTTLQNKELKISIQKWILELTIKIDCARITQSDILCKNGVVHKINSVLIPQSKA
jgi:uncharacterized surface protein with fasciclin (FAS1) repeats